MRGRILAVIIAMSFASGLVMAACGETDPAQAPLGATINFLSAQGNGTEVTETWTFPVNSTYNVPTSCSEAFENQMSALCNQLAATTAGQAILDAAGVAGCDNPGDWLPLIDVGRGDGTWGEYIASRFQPGDCGYLESIVTALVSRGVGTGVSTLSGEPLNGVEVRWIATTGLELYELADIPGEIDPLANPYLDETDERGVTELKTRAPLPIATGVTYDVVVWADIGVAKAQYKFTFTAEEGETSDDDASDDDDADDDAE